MPNDPVVKNMTENDYLYCYAHMMLDKEKTYEEYIFNESFNPEEYKRKCGEY